MEADNSIVIVVASQPELARIEYDRYGVYMCPAPYFITENDEIIPTGYVKQLFWECSHFAFYGSNHVAQKVPRIQARIESVLLTQDGVEQISGDDLEGQDLESLKNRLFRLVERIETDRNPPSGGFRAGNWHQVYFLSKPGDAETIDLGRPIVNDKTDRNGRRTAFTRKFCYVTLSNLLTARRTTQLKAI